MAESEEQFQFKISNKQVQRTEEQKEPKIGQAGNVEFERIEIADLQSIPVAAQALDNQWLPHELLGPAFQAGGITPDIDKRLRKLVRSEYIRSLINSQQVILNRAYLYNSAAVAQDYAEKHNPMREVFKEFLAKETIVPFLLAEQTPVDPPAGGQRVTPFRVTETFPQWQEVCQEVRPRCLRLSWNDQKNDRLLDTLLTRRLSTFARGLTDLEMDLYVKDLGLDDSAKESFYQRLIDVQRFCLELAAERKRVSRDALYKEFVVAGDDPEKQNTAERRYDRSKPFAAELKQLFDLRYNCNLPDAMNGYLITPVDSLPRTALQELEQANKKQPDIKGGEIVTLLKRTTFNLVQKGLNLPSMDLLSLQDVAEIRRMDEWTVYMEQLKRLLADPLGFADGGAAHVYESYERLTGRITDLVAKQRGEHLLTLWSASVEIVFSIAGATLSLLLTPAGPIYSLSGQIAGIAAGSAASLVGKLVIRDVNEKHAQQDLSMSIDFLQRRLKDAETQWEEIEKQVRELPGFKGASPMETKEIVDPTLNYSDNQEVGSQA